MTTRKRSRPPTLKPTRLEPNIARGEPEARTSLQGTSDADAVEDDTFTLELRQHLEALFGGPTPWSQGLTETEREGLEGRVRLDHLFAAFFYGRYQEGPLDQYDESLWLALVRLAALRGSIEGRSHRKKLIELKRALAAATKSIKLPPSPVIVRNSTHRMRPFRDAVYWEEHRDDRGDTKILLSYGTPILRRGRPQKTEEYQALRQRIVGRYESLVEPVEQVLVTTGGRQRSEMRARLGPDDARRFSKAEEELRQARISLTPARVVTRMLSIEIHERLGGTRVSEWAIRKLRPKQPRRPGPSGMRGK